MRLEFHLKICNYKFINFELHLKIIKGWKCALQWSPANTLSLPLQQNRHLIIRICRDEQPRNPACFYSHIVLCHLSSHPLYSAHSPIMVPPKFCKNICKNPNKKLPGNFIFFVSGVSNKS
ncbi:hypothetical protein DR999_PMT11911 [Platysternon megacephalum]|uniref:Uncharacterized protein n=1 Tax=Platysternon megacephalum TaxID=55544 RepID=A0A4D9E3I4_9SAUR|nr:hypothetical protein DR999_PMT11911 [Platysternon megacephalum]